MIDYDAMTDEGLMAEFQRTLDGRAFEQITARYLLAGCAVARQILFNRSLAEDAAQEAFLRVVRNAGRYEPDKPFSVWFYTILRNVCLDLLRRHKREQRTIEQIVADGPATEAAAEEPGEADHLLRLLPPSERDAVSLRVVHGLPFADVAAALAISEEAAKKRVQRGLARLRSRVEARQRAL